MGIYLNPDNKNFQATLTREIYVDKTEMLSVINKFMSVDNKYICVSRPRRFGKTITSNMLAAYFSKNCNSEDLFKPYKIYKDPDFKKNLNKFNVIKIDLNSEYQNHFDKENFLFNLTKKIKIELIQAFSDAQIQEEDSLGESILKVYYKTNQTFIIIIDEYDVLVREKISDKLFSDYLSLLNGLFKSDTLRPAISLAYLTGILPIIRDKVQSKLNNFREYTMIDAKELTPFVGFTSEEVQALCKQYHIDYEECKNWYDGYYQNGVEIYNPESVILCLEQKKFNGFWGQTSSYEVISDRITENFKGIKDDVIKMISGEGVYVDSGMYKNTIKDFASKDDIFTYLMHLGYLTYNEANQTCSIPNKEVRQDWIRAISILNDYSVTDEIIKASKDLLEETISGNEAEVAAALDKSHIHVTSNRSYNNEDALQSAIYLSYIFALNKYTCIKEMTTGKGFADVVYIPLKESDPAIIIELKKDSCADTALNQIKEKQYFDSLHHFKGNIIFVGINYDEKSKTHECKIERFVK